MPIIGWMWYFLEMVFCKRKWEEDRKTVMQGLLNLRDYPENFWVNVGSEIIQSNWCCIFKRIKAKNTGNLEHGIMFCKCHCQ